MSQPSFKFVHASDLHLERPLGGVLEVPEHLREVFLEAPFEAAKKVFETVLSEGVDALILSGDIVDFDLAGPRAIVFLRDQFQRLADHKIPVYWACGDIDPADSWPATVPLPSNVHIFPVGEVETLELRREGDLIANVQGISRNQGAAEDDTGFHRHVNGLFTIGVSYGTTASPGTEGDRVHYMALGGKHARQTVDQSPGIAHYSGTPQGRTPEEKGPKGCTLISVDETGHTKTSFVATDSIRWLTEEVEIVAGTEEDALLSQMNTRIQKLQTKHVGTPLLITWVITGRGQVLNHIRRGGISDEMTTRLREKYALATPSIWTVGIECHEPLDVPQEWVDEETIMGDMLREFRTLEEDESISLELEEFLPAELRTESWSTLAEVNPEDRPELLWAASKMAVDLLDGDEELSE